MSVYTPTSPKQPRGHDELKALDLVITVAPERALKCAEADLAWALDHIATLERKPKRTRGPCAFKQTDVERAIKAVKAAGASVGKVEVTKDKITVEVGKGEVDEGEQPENVLPLDAWRSRHAKG